MRRKYYGIVLAAVIAASGAVMWVAWATVSSTRVISISELQAGTEFVLAGVHFKQLGYSYDLNLPDARAHVTFEMTFADGAHEVVDFPVGHYCAVGTASESSTVHRAPAVVFRYVCGEDVVWVRII